MKRNFIIPIIWCLMLMISLKSSAATVKIRLVEAFNSNQASVSSGLQDVSGILKKNLRFNSFKLLGSNIVNLPANAPVTIGPYQLILTGDSGNLSVRVLKDRKNIFQSKVKLIQNSPVLIGGFQGKTGKIIFIFNSKD